jgi:hypothetical protein
MFVSNTYNTSSVCVKPRFIRWSASVLDESRKQKRLEYHLIKDNNSFCTFENEFKATLDVSEMSGRFALQEDSL